MLSSTEDHETLHYSSDDDFTPTILSSFSFSPTVNVKVQNENQLGTNEIITKKLEFISDQISCMQDMLHTVIAKHEQMEMLWTSASTVKDDEIKKGKISRCLKCEPDDPCGTNSIHFCVSDDDSFLRYRFAENGATKWNQEPQHKSVDEYSSSKKWVHPIHLVLTALFSWILNIFGNREIEEEIIQKHYQMQDQRKNAETLKVLKIPDDVKIEIELRKARRVHVE
jgi:hypothetical protein